MIRTGSSLTLGRAPHDPGPALWTNRTPLRVSIFWGAETAGVISKASQASIPVVAAARIFMLDSFPEPAPPCRADPLAHSYSRPAFSV